MHDQHMFSAQAFASMHWERQRLSWPADGEDEHVTHGGGAGACVLSRCPSYASTSVTPALVDEATGEIYHERKWEGTQCSDGVWKDTTRGDGDTGEQDQSWPVIHGHTGHFGVVTANWGGRWGEEHLEVHMNEDLKTTPCQVVAMQEAEPKCMEFLNEPIRGGSGLGKGGWAR